MELAYDSRLGSGAFADVWLATDAIMRKVAVKFIRGTTPSRTEEVALQHAKALARVDHPAVVRLYAVEQQRHPEEGDERLAIVMEYLDGSNLSLHTGRLTVEFVRLAITQLAAGIEVIHAAGLVHGDLHDGNIMLTSTGAKLVDLLYTHSLSEVGSRTAARTRKDDIRELGNVCRILCGKADITTREIQEAYFRATNSAMSAAEVCDLFMPILTVAAPGTPPTPAASSSTERSVGMRVDDLQRAFELELGRAATSAWDAVRALSDDLTQGNADRILRLAVEHRAVAPGGLLVVLPHPGYRARFTLAENLVTVTIETHSQEELVKATWLPDQTAIELLTQLILTLRKEEQFEAATAVDGSIFQGLVTALAVGIEARFQNAPDDFQSPGRRYVPSELSPVIMVVNEQWAVTTYGLECIRHSYPIAANRLAEKDWLTHLSEKTWANEDFVSDALDEARRIHGVAVK